MGDGAGAGGNADDWESSGDSGRGTSMIDDLNMELSDDRLVDDAEASVDTTMVLDLGLHKKCLFAPQGAVVMLIAGFPCVLCEVGNEALCESWTKLKLYWFWDWDL